MGETLTVDTSGISDADGMDNAVFAYQWPADDSDIAGATASSYTLAAADEGKTVKVRVSFTDDAGNEETLTSAATSLVGAESDIEPNVGYVTVVVQENNSDPDTPATDFTVTWNDPEECSDGYSAYISGWVGSVLDLGSTDSDGTQIAKTVPQSDLEGGMGYNVEVYCGVRDPGWYIEPAHVPEYGPSHTPVPGTYSSEPGLTGLTVTEGSLAPSFHQYRFVHTLEDVPSDAKRITLNATVKAGHSVVVLGDSVTVMGSCNGWECEFTYEEAGSDNKVEPLKDADEDLDGFQMDLADDQTHFSIHVPTVSRIGRVYRFSLSRLTPEPLTEPGGQDGNTQATGLPAISGTAQVGQSLVADTSGIDDADGLTSVSYSYQWIRSDGNTDTDIAGATGSTYTLVSADVGKAIKVKVSFTDDADHEETLTSPATAAVAARPNTPATGAPAIAGTAQVDETLTADTSGIADVDGLADAVFSYQWLADDANIQGATDSTYTLADSDEGKAIQVKVSFTDDAGNEETLTSAATSLVGAESDIEPNVGYVTVVVQENNSDPDTPATDFTVTWNDPEECSDGYSAYISGWVGSVLDLGSTDSDGTQIAKTVPQSDLEGGMGYNVEVYCGVRDPGWYIEPAHVPEYGPSHTPVPGTYSSEPGLTGLTVTEGSLAPSFHQYRFVHTLEDVPSDAKRITLNATVKAGHSVVVLGDSVTVMGSCNGWECEFTYEEAGSDNKVEPLKDADEDLDGFQMDLADDQTHFSIHVPTVSRIGRVYRFSLSRLTPEPLTEPGGQDGNTQATGLPAISGTAQVGQSLVADTSGIDDADGLTSVSYSYQWIRSDGNTDTDIAGATGSTYTLVSADVGKAIKVKVSFTDDADHEETLTSPATAAVEYVDGPPGAPRDVKVEAGDTKLQVSWQPPADESKAPVEQYRILYREDGGSNQELHTTRLTKTINNLTNGVTYEVQVTAKNAAGYGTPSDEMSDTPQAADEALLWSADMLVVEYTSVSIGAASADLFSNEGGSAGLQVKSLWSYKPDRDLRLAFEEAVPGAADLTLQVGDLRLAFPAGSSGQSSFRWNDVDVDWEDGQTLAVRIVPTSATAAPQPNNPATGAPTIGGTAQAGETLTANTSGIADTDGLYNAVLSYQWLANDADIQGATNSRYTLSDDDVGKAIKVRVSFTDNANNEETLTSAPTAAVEARLNTPATGLPAINGTVQVGETLTVDTSAIADADGLDKAIFSYRWLADDANIEGATDSTYTLADRDEGKAIKVRVSFTDDGNNEETLTSAATAAVTAKPNTPATGAPTISGTPQVGETLTADTTSIADADGPTNPSFSYQWVANDTDIDGASNSTYTLVSADEGKTIKVKVSFTDDADHEETLTSAATAAVAARPNTPATGAPAIAGTAQVGETLTADTSGIADVDGLDDATFTYQWLADDANIQGATDSTYTLADSDEGKAVQVKVSVYRRRR